MKLDKAAMLRKKMLEWKDMMLGGQDRKGKKSKLREFREAEVNLD
jgi:hypothetical protein